MSKIIFQNIYYTRHFNHKWIQRTFFHNILVQKTYFHNFDGWLLLWFLFFLNSEKSNNLENLLLFLILIWLTLSSNVLKSFSSDIKEISSWCFHSESCKLVCEFVNLLLLFGGVMLWIFRQTVALVDMLRCK